jgi:hypothetical protein
MTQLCISLMVENTHNSKSELSQTANLRARTRCIQVPDFCFETIKYDSLTMLINRQLPVFKRTLMKF